MPKAKSNLVLPQDLKAVLLANGHARSLFAALAPSHKRDYLKWIEGAKKDETRRKRIEKTVAMLLDRNRNA
jgi:uncharacterized protein YdeI (YjbR/CyaY-like superfamily)